MFKELIETYVKALTADDSIFSSALFSGADCAPEFSGTAARAMKFYREAFSLGETPTLGAFSDMLLRGSQELRRPSCAVRIAPVLVVGLCPHHLAPVHYELEFTYTPGAVRVGLSKIPRFLRKIYSFPVVQEELGDVAVKLFKHVTGAKSVGLVAKGQHMCVTARGARAAGAVAITEHKH